MAPHGFQPAPRASHQEDFTSSADLPALDSAPSSGFNSQLRRQAQIWLLSTEAILASSPRAALPCSAACAVPPSPVSPQVPDSLGAAQDRDGAGSSSVVSPDRHLVS